MKEVWTNANLVKRIWTLNLRILEKNEDSMRFVVEGISTPLANTVRRIMLAEVPSMAIHEIVVIENSSVLHDEIISLRLGLIPLKTDLDAYNLPEECDCKSELGCHLCRTVLTLDVEAKNESRTIYSGDLLPEDPNVAPVSGKIPIVKLAPNQRVRLEAYARLGKGKVHAKWQPVSACTYRYMPVVKMNQADCDVCGACVDICPKRVFEKKENMIDVAKPLECVLCEDCVEACSKTKNPAAIQVRGEENSFVFYVESGGALPVERVVSEAFKIYEKKYSEFMSQLAGIEDESKKAD